MAGLSPARIVPCPAHYEQTPVSVRKQGFVDGLSLPLAGEGFGVVLKYLYRFYVPDAAALHKSYRQDDLFFFHIFRPELG